MDITVRLDLSRGLKLARYSHVDTTHLHILVFEPFP
jgi:hypothetical protein